jgi:hypothetical protein
MEPGHLFVVGIDQRVPIEIRERISFSKKEADALKRSS